MTKVTETNNQVAIYTFTYEIEGKLYCGHIPALSWDDAQQQLGPKFMVDGQLIETQPVGQICSICAGDMKIDETNPQPVESEWAEVID